MSQDNKNETTELDVRIPVFTQTGGATYPALDKWQQIDEDEVEIVYQMTMRNELSGGTPVVREFEQTWRQRIGSKYALTVVNGTMALYSALFGIGLGPGDEFLCPTFTWISSLSGGLMLGARPVLCESDPESLMLDPQDVRRRITDKTRAIMAVHLWGNVCDMDALLQISEETGIPIVEDCSHAHGAMYKGRHAGTMGTVGCWSLQGSKPISAGEGGVLATDDIDVFERACILGQVNRLGGVDLATERYQDLQPFGLGMKTRSHPLGIGIAQVQLKKLAELNARRRGFIEAVEAGLADLPGLKPVKIYEGAERGGFYGFPMLHVPEESGVSTASFIDALQAEGLPAQGSPYPLLHRLPLFRDGFDIFTRNRGPLSGDYTGYKEGDLPVTEEMARRLVFLPVLSDPVPGAADKVIKAIRRGVARVR